MKTAAASLLLALCAAATSAEGAPPTKEQYVKAALANLNATSRTAGGTVDTSASKDKAASMAEVSGEQAAQLANKNFEAALGKLHDSRKQTFATPLDMQNDAPQFAQWLKFYKSLFK